MSRFAWAAALAMVLVDGPARALAGVEPGCRCKVRVGSPAEPASRIPLTSFDHSTLDALLLRYVDGEGMVAYGAWKCHPTDSALLHEYLESMAGVNADDPSAPQSAVLAFHINAYNALVIWGILQQYPTSSIQRHNRPRAAYKIFDDLEVCIGGEFVSLNAIEHEILRPLGDPRIHFALVCAARSCPRLRDEAYAADRLDEQLDDNAREFFARRDRFTICRVTKTVKLSPILDWFHDDFGSTDREVLDRIGVYLSDRDRCWLESHPCPKVSYLGYDWSLNDRCPTLGIRLGSIPYSAYARIRPLFPRGAGTRRAPADSPDAMEPAPDLEPAPPATPQPPPSPAPRVL